MFVSGYGISHCVTKLNCKNADSASAGQDSLQPAFPDNSAAGLWGDPAGLVGWQVVGFHPHMCLPAEHSKVRTVLVLLVVMVVLLLLTVV